MKVPNEAIPVEEYLKEPQWLVAAITEANRIETLADNHFRLKLRPKKFMHLQFEPQADLKVNTDADGTLHIRSTGCRVIGLENLEKSFTMDLTGELGPRRQGQTTWLEGIARIQVRFELPSVLSIIPKAVLKPTGNTFLGSILGTMKGRVKRQLVKDYQRWAAQKTTSNSPSFAAQEPTG